MGHALVLVDNPVAESVRHASMTVVQLTAKRLEIICALVELANRSDCDLRSRLDARRIRTFIEHARAASQGEIVTVAATR